MLLSAIQALQPGGMVVYATCALAKAENDSVVERVLERLAHKAQEYNYRAELAPPDAPSCYPAWIERTAMGIQVWPDTSDGRGPLFISRIERCLIS
jgi:16S rRNA C967 or C1407 C5-methylase (RsmB/RsmF family)